MSVDETIARTRHGPSRCRGRRLQRCAPVPDRIRWNRRNRRVARRPRTAEALRPATVIAGHKDPRASTIHHRSRQHGAISPTRADCLSRRNRPTSSTRRCCVCTLGESTRARYGAQQSLCFPRSARPRLRRSSMLGAPFDRADDPARNKPRALGYELMAVSSRPTGLKRAARAC